MDKVSFGYEDVPPAEKTQRVGRVFSSVAWRYDLMNDLMSAGLHRHWKNQFVRRLKPRRGEAILDMAGGTGDIALRIVPTGARVTVADINADMLAIGQGRARRRGVDDLVWVQEDAEQLSFADRSFDAYAIAFGIRNVTDIAAALAEAHRVTRIGGRFFCLEFSTPTWPGFKEVYDRYSHDIVPRLGRVVADNAESYRYLIESIRRFPDTVAFRRTIEAAGFTNVRVEPILGGLVAIHSGWKT